MLISTHEPKETCWISSLASLSMLPKRFLLIVCASMFYTSTRVAGITSAECVAVLDSEHDGYESLKDSAMWGKIWLKISELGTNTGNSKRPRVSSTGNKKGSEV